ncbi:MAG: formyltransferase family protein [Halobacteriaceae archaeon]
MQLVGLTRDEGTTLRHLASRQPGGVTLSRILAAEPTASVLDAAPTWDPSVSTTTVSDDSLGATLGEADLVYVEAASGAILETLAGLECTAITAHPSLLPSFDGERPVETALAADVRVTGATVHLVTPGADRQILTQEPVPLRPSDDVETLRTRVETDGVRPAAVRAVRELATGGIEVNATDGVSTTETGGFARQRIDSAGKVEDLRYGENPHQEAALYASDGSGPAGLVDAPQVNAGAKGMSYTNYLDAAAGLDLVREFDRPAAALIKHATPAGVATASDLETAYADALATDPMSAFGGVVALNRPCDPETAARIVESVKHVVVAPGYADGSLDRLTERENMRVIDANDLGDGAALEARPLVGGRLIQDRDRGGLSRGNLTTVTDREPTAAELETMLFAWRAVKHARSNGIVFANGRETVGIGGGQVSRVDAVEIAAKKAAEHAEGTSAEGAVMASDGFFPFPDGIEAAADAGVDAVIQPGGSINDETVTERADELNLAMVHTGRRCFRHG